MRKLISLFLALLVVCVVYAQESVIRRGGTVSTIPLGTNGQMVFYTPTNAWVPSQNYMGNNFQYFNGITATGGVAHVMGLGDSFTADGGGFYGDLFNAFNDYYGFAGAIGVCRGRLNFQVSAGAYPTNDYNTFYQTFYVLPPGGIVTLMSTNWVSFTNNVYEIDFLASNGLGGFKVETNLNGAGWNTMVPAVVCNTNAGIVAGVPLRLTNSAGVSAFQQMRITSLSNTCVILMMGAINYGTNYGTVFQDISTSGSVIGDLMLSPTNITGPLLRSWNPSIIALKWYESYDSLTRSNSLANLTAMLNYYPTNSDILWIAAHPKQSYTADTDPRLMNLLYMTNCIAQGDWNFYGDGFNIFGQTFEKAFSSGMLNTFDEHASIAGDKYLVDCLLPYINPSIGGQNNSVNGPGRPILLANRNIDLYSQGIYLRGTSPFNNSMGVINWIQGSTNLSLYIDTTGGKRSWVFREGGGGYNALEVKTLSGTVFILPGDATSGAVYNLGGPSAGEGWRNAYASNYFGWAGPASSGAMFKMGGTLFTNFVSTGNGAGAETVLYTNTVKGSTLFNIGDSLRITAGGTYAATANAKLIVLRFGPTIVFTNNSIINSGSWRFQADIFRTTATAQKIVAVLDTSSAAIQSGTYTTAANTLANDVGLSLTGNGVGASDVVGEIWKVEWLPGAPQ